MSVCIYSRVICVQLQVILAVGNYMNAGNVRVGGAIGFRISFLTKVSIKNLDTA